MVRTVYAPLVLCALASPARLFATCCSLLPPAPRSLRRSLQGKTSDVGLCAEPGGNRWRTLYRHRGLWLTRGGGEKNGVLASSRPHIFTSVECLGLYFNRTHNTQNLLLKKQRTRDICTTTHSPLTTGVTQQSLEARDFCVGPPLYFVIPDEVLLQPFMPTIVVLFPVGSQLLLVCFPLS